LEKVRTGLADYFETGEYSPDFIADVSMLIYKTYNQWSLYDDEDEFFSSCWTKVVGSVKLYDEKDGREEGPLTNYLYQVIKNEARRIYSKHKRMSYDDIDELPNCDRVWCNSEDSDLDIRDRVCSFARRAFKKGVFVNQESLYRNYILKNLTPAVKAFMWDSIFS